MTDLLKKYGFDYNPVPEKELFSCGLITVVNKERFIVYDGETELQAEITGKMMFEAESEKNFPIVGDWVFFQPFDDAHAIVHEILPRKSILERKRPGTKSKSQPLVANVDVAIVVQSLDRDLNIKRFERYLVMLKKANIKPVLLISKNDLTADHDTVCKLETLKNHFNDITIVPFSNFNDEDVQFIKNMLEPGKTYCLIGSSGVGKSTLLNNLLGEEVLKTNEVRIKDSRGKHTTTKRQLFLLDNYIKIIDTPGIRELGMLDMGAEIDNSFKNVVDFAEFCKFKDCTHTNEPGCGVLKALKDGTISEEQYNNYQKLKKEVAFYETSLLDKKQKDKTFGKMQKRVVKHRIKNKY